MNTPIITSDLFFGDGGKGTIVDYLVGKFDKTLVVRYNGGFQAEHNVVTPEGIHHTFSAFGSGTFHPQCDTLLSKHVLVEPLALENEAIRLNSHGIKMPYSRVYIDGRAKITTPYHIIASRINPSKHGTTGFGVGLTMSDSIKYPEDTLTVWEAKYQKDVAIGKLESVRDRYNTIVDYTLPEAELVYNLYETILAKLDVVSADDANALVFENNVIFENAQGILLDEDYGFHPHTTWSKCTKVNALEILSEAGVSEAPTTVGIMRAYATRHGSGPFPTYSPMLTEAINEPHNKSDEYAGLFKNGWLDFNLLRYAINVNNGVDYLAVTHIDSVSNLGGFKYSDSYTTIFDYLHKPVSISQQEEITNYLSKAVPVYDVARSKHLIDVIEEQLGTEVGIISDGQNRTDKKFVLQA